MPSQEPPQIGRQQENPDNEGLPDYITEEDDLPF
jgi:hypothetical protein